jgi:hypothetical protein
MILAFVVGGLREIGEPARKAMIVDLALLWSIAPEVPVYCCRCHWHNRDVSLPRQLKNNLQVKQTRLGVLN